MWLLILEEICERIPRMNQITRFYGDRQQSSGGLPHLVEYRPCVFLEKQGSAGHVKTPVRRESERRCRADVSVPLDVLYSIIIIAEKFDQARFIGSVPLEHGSGTVLGKRALVQGRHDYSPQSVPGFCLNLMSNLIRVDLVESNFPALRPVSIRQVKLKCTVVPRWAIGTGMLVCW